jgi:hypothetical protein
MSATLTKPAWDRFDAIAAEVHDMLIGAAQCRNHLTAILWSKDEFEMSDELHEAISNALERLTRVGI